MSDFAEKEFERMLRDYYRVETVDLQAPRDLWERVYKRLAKPRRPSLSLRLMERRYLFAAVAAAAVLAVFFALTRPGLQPTETVSAQEVIEHLQEVSGNLAAVGVRSYEATMESRGLRRTGVELKPETVVWQRHIWFVAPDKFRQESREIQPLWAGSERLFVSDGITTWLYTPTENQVIINEAEAGLGPNQPPTTGLAETVGEGKYYDATLVGTDVVAGREAYLLELRPTFERHVSSSDPDLIEGLVKWWLDKETYFELKMEQYTEDGLLYDSRVYTSIQYNVYLPDDLFTFQIPEGATVIDHRPLSVPVASPEAQTFWAQIAKEVDFQLFAPGYIPEALPEPEILVEGYPDTPKTVELIYGSPLEDASFLSIDERGITEDLQAYIPQDAMVVEIGEIEGRLTAGDERSVPTRLYLVREGTYILLQSFGLSNEELIAIAISLEPMSRMSPVPTPTPTAEIVPDFRVFTPTYVPTGLTPAEPEVWLTGQAFYRQVYGAGLLKITQTRGTSQWVDSLPSPVRAAPEVTVHGLPGRLLSASEVGGWLWWIEDGTYIQVYSESLPPGELMKIAESME